MSKFLTSNSVQYEDNTYTPENGVVTLPDEADALAINRLGLSKYIEVQAATATTTTEAQ